MFTDQWIKLPLFSLFGIVLFVLYALMLPMASLAHDSQGGTSEMQDSFEVATLYE